MKNELKQELTRRLCECNNGGLVLVMYDIYFGFSEDVKAALASNDRAALKKAVADVQAALDELMGALDFKYPLAGQLYPLYSYCKRLFSTVLYSLDVSLSIMLFSHCFNIFSSLCSVFKFSFQPEKSDHFPGIKSVNQLRFRLYS